jgi:magnesium transporter
VAQPLSGLVALRNLLQHRNAPGTSPGALYVHPAAKRTSVCVFSYGPEACSETRIDSLETLGELLGRGIVTWVDVDGLGDAARLERLGQILGLHPLALEDAVGGSQRPKVEFYQEHCFIVVHMISIGERIESEQLSLFLRPGLVVSLQGGRPGDSLDPVRKRIRQGRGALRNSGSDYLVYTLLDAVVDGYFPVLEEFGERLEKLEHEVVEGRVAKTAPRRIYAAKHDLMTVRRALWPMRDALGTLLRDGTEQLSRETLVYLRDCHDHTIQLLEIVDTYREVASNLMDMYLSSVSNRMNEVMKVLTVMATLFIPLTFIAGVYGMNFDASDSPWNMPELRWRYGYPFSLGLMGVTAAGLVLYFRAKGWVGKGR